MKNQTRYLLLFFFSLSSGFLSAQTFLGFKGQVNNMGAPLVIKRDLLSKSLATSLNPGFGLYAEFKINERWSIQTELNYQERRRSFLLTGSEKTINTSVLEYISVPILIKYSIPLKNLNLTGLLGPSTGYAFRLKSGETDQDYRFTGYEVLDFEENQVRHFEMGLLSGIGIEKLIANKFKTTLCLRYHFGILDIMKAPLSTFRNSGYILDVGFMIPFDLFTKQE